jgi:hypothetical protein
LKRIAPAMDWRTACSSRSINSLRWGLDIPFNVA